MDSISPSRAHWQLSNRQMRGVHGPCLRSVHDVSAYHDHHWHAVCCECNGRGTGPGTAAHWEAQPPVVAQGAAAALSTRPLPQPTASSLVVGFVLRVQACGSRHGVSSTHCSAPSTRCTGLTANAAGPRALSTRANQVHQSASRPRAGFALGMGSRWQGVRFGASGRPVCSSILTAFLDYLGEALVHY